MQNECSRVSWSGPRHTRRSGLSADRESRRDDGGVISGKYGMFRTPYGPSARAGFVKLGTHGSGCVAALPRMMVNDSFRTAVLYQTVEIVYFQYAS